MNDLFGGLVFKLQIWETKNMIRVPFVFALVPFNAFCTLNCLEISMLVGCFRAAVM